MTNIKITITGDLGSGKSAVSNLLCERTGYDYVSTGRIQRQLAQEMGIDTLEMNRRAYRNASGSLEDQTPPAIAAACCQEP